MRTPARDQRRVETLTTNALLFGRLVSRVETLGVDLEEPCLASGVQPDMINQPGHRLPVSAAVTLLQKCRVLCKDEFIGLLRDPIPLGYFRLSALAAVSQDSLGRALDRYIDYGNTFFNSLRFHLNHSDTTVSLVVTRDAQGIVHDNVAIDSVLATTHRLLGWLCDDLIVLDKVRLDFTAPAYRSEYKYLYYRSPVEFSSPYNSLVFNARYLDLPVLQNEATANAYIRRAPLDIYLPQDIHGVTSRIIREHLKLSIKANAATAELQTIADALNISSQTLRRRLAKERTTFNDIKSQVRRDLAMNALGQKSLSIEAVAEQAGYSEPAAFIRAFKRWTGMTPAKFRKLIRMTD